MLFIRPIIVLAYPEWENQRMRWRCESLFNPIFLILNLGMDPTPYTGYGFVPTVKFINFQPSSIRVPKYLTYTFVKAGLFFILALLHLCFFIFYPSQKANLFFAISSLLFFVHWLGLGLKMTWLLSDLDTLMYVGQLRAVLFPVNYVFSYRPLYRLRVT